MCGIAGFYNAIVTPNQLDRLTGCLRHRGPDAQQQYQKDKVGLVHTRLSIIELSSLGAQPYRFENLVLVFNGELYNYKEIRESLKVAGYIFNSNADTEVLIKAFHCWREQCVDHFIGMFAFSVYDEASHEIFLFRDRVGVKPLYYSFQEGKLFFASELKALSVFELSKEINTDAVSLYLRFGFVPHNLSIFKGVSKLEAGHYLKINREGLVNRKYWSVNREKITGKNEDQWVDELEALMISAFRYRMVSDVPVGVFLSGGMDSSLLTAVLQKSYGNINTFTIGFEEGIFDESVFARRVADHLKTHHTQKVLKLNEAKTLLNDFYSIYDEPFADTSGIPTACVTTLAKGSGMKVVLSADGGDELYGGYSHYMKACDLYNKFKSIPARIRRDITRATTFLLPDVIRKNLNFLNIEHRAYSAEELLLAGNPVEFFEAFIANQSGGEISKMLNFRGKTSMDFAFPGAQEIEAMMAWDFHYYLPDDLLVKVDRATMYFGIECREPFLDHRLVEFAARMPTELKIKDGKTKYILRKLLSRYIPAENFDRKKQGFSIPVFEWFGKELDSMFNEYLSDQNLGKVPFFNVQEIQREHNKYRIYRKQGRQYNMEKMWRILSFMLWWEKYMEYEG